jgi:hypothetical protein
MDKKEFLEALREVYCRLGCTQNGVGLIAIRRIPKGVDLFKNCDPFGDVLQVSQTELDAFDAPEEAKKLVRDFCALQDGIHYVPNYGIDAIPKCYFLNHSAQPNIMTPDKGETFFAARDIEAGEELTANYDDYHEAKHFIRK